MFKLPRSRSRAVKASTHRRVRLNLEVLEDRSLPSGSAPLLGFTDILSTPFGSMVVNREIALPNGAHLQVGTIQDSTGAWDFAVARTTPHGRLDQTFGVGGVVETNIPNGNGAFSSALAADEAFDVLVQPDGKYVVVGGAEGYGALGMAIVRYNPNGSLDSSFGTNGVVLTDVDGIAVSAALQPDGKIVVAGDSTEYSGPQELTVARYNANGQLDTSFGDSGLVRLSVNGQNSAYADAVVIQPNGQIVVAGTADTVTHNNRADSFADVVTRLNSDGDVDSNFGTGGAIVIPVTASTTTGVDGVSLSANGTITLVDGSRTLIVFEGSGSQQNNNGGGTVNEPPPAPTPPPEPVGPKLPTTEGQSPQKLPEATGGATETLTQTAPIDTETEQSSASADQGQAVVQLSPANSGAVESVAQIAPLVTAVEQLSTLAISNTAAQTALLTSMLLRPNAAGPFDPNRWVMSIVDDKAANAMPAPDQPAKPADALGDQPAKPEELPIPQAEDPSGESD